MYLFIQLCVYMYFYIVTIQTCICIYTQTHTWRERQRERDETGHKSEIDPLGPQTASCKASLGDTLAGIVALEKLQARGAPYVEVRGIV